MGVVEEREVVSGGELRALKSQSPQLLTASTLLSYLIVIRHT